MASLYAPWRRITSHTWLASGVMECRLECGHTRVVTSEFHRDQQQCIDCLLADGPPAPSKRGKR